MDFLLPLVTFMMVQDPILRPDAAAVLERWSQIRGRVSTLRRVARARERSEGIVKRVVFDVFASLKLGMLLSQKSIRWVWGMAMCWRRA